jgi:hypothetical protein
VISQDFPVSKYNMTYIKKLFERNGFEVVESDWLNHTIFPFSRLLPKLSIKVAQWLSGKNLLGLISFFSTDFVIRAKPKSSL